jgi:hypothetical protein
MKRHTEPTNQIEKQWQPKVEELEPRVVPGMLMITTPSGMISSQTLNAKVVGHLETAQSHTNGVITWTP